MRGIAKDFWINNETIDRNENLHRPAGYRADRAAQWKLPHAMSFPSLISKHASSSARHVHTENRIQVLIAGEQHSVLRCRWRTAEEGEAQTRPTSTCIFLSPARLSLLLYYKHWDNLGPQPRVRVCPAFLIFYPRFFFFFIHHTLSTHKDV